MPLDLDGFRPSGSPWFRRLRRGNCPRSGAEEYL